jgi:hypothetical protein
MGGRSSATDWVSLLASSRNFTPRGGRIQGYEGVHSGSTAAIGVTGRLLYLVAVLGHHDHRPANECPTSAEGSCGVEAAGFEP